MEIPGGQLLHRNLIGVGLVLAGLLAGVLLMQFTQQARPDFPAELRTVEFHKNAPLLAEREVSTAGVLQLNEQFKQVSHDVKRAVVSIHAASSWYSVPCAILKRRSKEYRDRESLGSGVLISPQGYIVTNYHLVEDACGLRVTFLDKEEYEAEVVGVDQSTDLAVVRIMLKPGKEVKPLPLGDSDEVQTGEWVLAVGNPLALTSTVTAGIVSALGRHVNIIQDESNVEDFIQTDAAINPGNSGGALVNLQGELIGINTAIATQTGYNEGYGFAIPVNLVNRVVRDLITYGEVKRGYVGARFERVDARFAEELGLQEVRGVYLDYVVREGAAHQGGLRDGDVILALEGRPVNEPNELQSAIAQYHPGDSLTVRAWRRGITRNHFVILAGQDDPGVAAWVNSFLRQEPISDPHGGELFPVERWGLALRQLNDEDRLLFDVTSGVYVFHVRTGSIASRAGVLDHVVLKEINGEAVTSAREAQKKLEDAEEVLLTILHEDGQAVDLRLSEG